ncbi:MAG: ABC transporter ATP-binding protein [Ginsengibacter sp.]
MKKTAQNIFKILIPAEKGKFTQLVLLDVLISVLDICFLALLLFVVHFYTTEQHTLSGPYLPLKFLNKYPLLLIVVFFILFSVKNFCGFMVFRMQIRFVYGVASRLSQKNLSNYLDGSYSNYINIDSSVHIRAISQQSIEFGHYVLGGLQQIISQSILILITTTVVLIFKPVLFPLLFVVLTPPIMLTGIVMKKKLLAIRKMAKPLSEKTLQYLKEALSGYVESNVYERKNFFSKKYDESQAGFNIFLSEQFSMQNMPSRLIEVFAVLGLFVLILINSFTADSNSIHFIIVGAFMGAAYKIIPGIVKILNSNGQIKTYGFIIKDLLQSESEDYPVAKESRHVDTMYSIEFKNVSFSYKDELVLDNVSFHVSKEDFAGLTGKSGKGKTTIINLLLGFLEPASGSIHINKVSTTAEMRTHYWKNISYVKQQQLLIYDTILHNITLTEDFYDTQRLENIINIAGLGELIDKYPEKIDKVITEDGKNISGGQRQRIAIARALYKGGSLIILDEPFNELDKTSEKLFLEYFAELSKQGTLIILITHNRESFSFCNKIISLDEA